jgi:CheY-like chemotaxis protein
MKTRVLIVDDEIDTLNLLRTLLDIAGYEPITTLNSVEAITLAETEKPDVLLLDIMMPDLDGFTLCRMMRANEATQDLPIVFVTAYTALDLDERRKEAGADLLISKPIDLDILTRTINKALELRPGRFSPPD